MTDESYVLNTPCFESALSHELGTWNVCTNQRCARILRFGAPSLCPMCGAPTMAQKTPPLLVHGLSAYRHGVCKCAVCSAANADNVRTQRLRRQG